MIAAGALLVLGGVWLVVTGLIVRSELQDARASVHLLRQQVSDGDLAAARVTLADLQTSASRAHTWSSGPAWALAGALPGGGNPFESVRGIASAVDTLSSATLPALLDARDTLEPNQLRRADGSIDLAPIEQAAPTLAAADKALADATRQVAGLPEDTWLSPVDHARREMLAELTDIAGTVRSADLGAQILPQMLGVDGPKTYFVGFQNEAESRGTGGIPGAFGILQADNGRLKFLSFHNDSTLNGSRTGLTFGPDFAQMYGNYEPSNTYVNSDVSPHFPYAAQIWAAMWQKYSGQHLDGALAVDPTTLGYLLGATGGITMPDGTQVDGSNVVTLTQSTVYALKPDVNERKQYLLDIAKRVSEHLIDSTVSASSLVDAMGRAMGERRVLVWSADPAIEAELTRTSVSGAVPTTDAPYTGVVVINQSTSKLDYYLDRAITWQRTGCGSTRTVIAAVKLTNTAPASGLPPYVTIRSDLPRASARPGDNNDDVSYYAT
ncbi:MAG: hypothetical protein QOI15_2574, partial [Pseudonocardiales bacterium]|nr:hypothetical protein [Pseudonocardiales bacterium]